VGYKMGLLTLYSHDVQRARDFYAGTLGIPVVDQLTGPDFVFLQPEWGTPIALANANQAPAGATAEPAGFELGLEVADVEATRTEWLEKGVEVVSEIFDMGAGRCFYARDPEGRGLCPYQLYQATAEFRAARGI
jgi:predicted enzyme related to lactoylglutathione lyase